MLFIALSISELAEPPEAGQPVQWTEGQPCPVCGAALRKLYPYGRHHDATVAAFDCRTHSVLALFDTSGVCIMEPTTPGRMRPIGCSSTVTLHADFRGAAALARQHVDAMNYQTQKDNHAAQKRLR